LIASRSACHTQIVQVCSDDASIMSTMTSIIIWSTIVGYKVEAIDIINKTIAIIINTISSNLTLIHPYTTLDIFMLKVEASINQGHHHLTWRHIQSFQLLPGIEKTHTLRSPLLCPAGIYNSRLQRCIDLLIQFNKIQLISQFLFNQGHGLFNILPTTDLSNINSNSGQMMPGTRFESINFLEKPPRQAPRCVRSRTRGTSSSGFQEDALMTTPCKSSLMKTAGPFIALKM